jgi:hypothetical protein
LKRRVHFGVENPAANGEGGRMEELWELEDMGE